MYRINEVMNALIILFIEKGTDCQKNLYLYVASQFLYSIFINLFILFIYFCLHWVFVAVHRLSLVASSWG